MNNNDNSNNSNNTDYAALTAALEQYTATSNALSAIDNEFQTAMAELIAECYRNDFSALQEELAALEARIELLAIRHPEWFVKTKTLKTPFGSVASRSTTKLDVPNEEATIALLELRGEEARQFLRQRTYLALEALEGLDDGELRRLKVNRLTTEKITISPVRVDLGKAVKAAAKTPAPATP